jgi:hypothetical protein
MLYYKVIKENFLFETGAILKQERSGYVPVNRAFYTDAVPDDCSEYISSKIVENNPEYFKKVYAVDLLTKTVYKIKEEALEILKKIT